MVKEIEGLTEEERRALRGSKFAPLPSQPSSSTTSFPRVAHPGGPVATNKAAALAKFLERKLKEPGGLDSIKPELIESAVEKAKKTIYASGSGTSKAIRHVTTFHDCEVSSSDEELDPKKKKLKKEKKEKKRRKKKNKKKLKGKDQLC